MNRRGFIGALAGLPFAAVVQPKVGLPAVSSPPSHTTCSVSGASAYRFYSANEIRRAEGLSVTICCDTTEFRRELALAQCEIEGIEQQLTAALHRGIRVERS